MGTGLSDFKPCWHSTVAYGWRIINPRGRGQFSHCYIAHDSCWRYPPHWLTLGGWQRGQGTARVGRNAPGGSAILMARIVADRPRASALRSKRAGGGSSRGAARWTARVGWNARGGSTIFMGGIMADRPAGIRPTRIRRSWICPTRGICGLARGRIGAAPCGH